ncbi:MAG: protoporphyrinogen oxidase [Pirellulales bacterium]
MTTSATIRRRIAVIGGGIAGLAAAHRLTELQPACQPRLFEAAPRLGGVLHTDELDGYLVERSADMFLTNPAWALDLCRRVGLADELIGTDNSYRGSFVVRRGRLVRIPEGFVLMQPRKLWPLVTSPVLSPWGKLRMLGEWFVPRRGAADGDESLACFVRRRLGVEAYERLVQPLIGGIYTADGERLSLKATMPRFVEMEQRHGGLIRAALRSPPAGQPAGENSGGARYSMFMAPRRGMSSLVQAIANRLPAGCVELNAAVRSISRTEEGRWKLEFLSAGEPHAEFFDGLVMALPGPASARLLAPLDKELSRELAGIEYADSAVAVLGCRRDQISHRLDGFGFVVPDVEDRPIIAGSFSSVKFAGRAPQDRVLIRVFIGGARRPELAALPDDELRRIACVELGELIGLQGEPELFRVIRWRGAMPQYHLGHLDRVGQIEARAAALPNLALAGAAYRGVGIPDSIHSGEMAAERVWQGCQD